MIFSRIKSLQPVEDKEFDRLYTEDIQEYTFTHFTPIDVALSAASFLAHAPGIKVLDIGSGAGKFCLIGAATTDGIFTGVELRQNLHDSANQLKNKYGLLNVDFILANIEEIDLSAYQAFYFFNPFFENLLPAHSMDNAIPLDKELYHRYSSFVHDSLEKAPVGTRLVTYYSMFHEVPKSYRKVSTGLFPKLERWVKT